MVEQWSSKSHVWVRFPLSLIIRQSKYKFKYLPKQFHIFNIFYKFPIYNKKNKKIVTNSGIKNFENSSNFFYFSNNFSYRIMRSIVTYKSNSIFNNILTFFCFINYKNSFYVFNLFKGLNVYCNFLIFMQNNKFDALIYKMLFSYLKYDIILNLNNVNKCNLFSIFNFFFINKTYSLNK